jgi:hypothetical protein
LMMPFMRASAILPAPIKPIVSIIPPCCNQGPNYNLSYTFKRII